MIYYFSGTGNTRWVATSIANKIHCDAIDICSMAFDDFDHASLLSRISLDEPIGFAFPIHGWQPPHIVRRFVRSLPHSIFASRYVFAVCTGVDETGLALDIFAKELNKRGMKLNLTESVQMPNTYVCLPFMDIDPKNVEESKIKAAKLQIPKIAERILNRKEGEYLTKGSAPWFLTHVIGEYFNRRMVNDNKFKVDLSECAHCGRCHRVCPVGNIIDSGFMSEFTPKWKHDGTCTGCLACYHGCLKHGITYGDITRKRGQYRPFARLDPNQESK